MDAKAQEIRTYLGLPVPRPKVAFFELSSCEGCQLQIVNLSLIHISEPTRH